jgi:hypothetical protein
MASWLSLLVTALIALTCDQTSRAAAITYTTSGWVGTQSGNTGTNLKFASASGTLAPPETIALGSLTAQPLPDGIGLTYNHVSFGINVTFQTQGSSGMVTSGLSLQGEINGAIMGTQSSTAMATVTSVQATGPDTLPFPISSFNFGPQAIEPSGINGGITTLTGQVSAAVPEPTPLAIMGILAGWAALRSRCRRVTRRGG